MVIKHKVRIPKVALAALAFGGACDGNASSDGTTNNDGANGSTPKRVFEAFCMKVIECNPNDPPGQVYCEEVYSGYFDEEVGGQTAACQQAVLDIYDCYARNTCDENRDDADDSACAREQDRIDEACESFEDEGEDY